MAAWRKEGLPDSALTKLKALKDKEFQTKESFEAELAKVLPAGYQLWIEFILNDTGKGHTHEVYSVAYSPDGKMLASGSVDKTIKLWEAETGKEICTIKGHADSVRSVAFSADSKRLATASNDGTVKIWDLPTGKKAEK